MEFLFDLLLTAFFSLLFAFLLAKILSPSPSSSASSSGSGSASAFSRGAADVISGGAQSTAKDLPEETRAPRLREGDVLQEEKIIEVDNVVEKETERRFLAKEERSELSESVGIRSEGIEGMSDGFISYVEFEKGKVDQGLVQKDNSFELETSIDFEKEKESFPSEIRVGEVAPSSDFISAKDQSLVGPEESLWEVKSESQVENDDKDNLCEVEGSKDKIPREIGIPTKEDTCLKEEFEFKVESHGSVILQDEISRGAVVSGEFEKGKDEKNNLCEEEGSISKTATEGEAHLEELTMPEEIPVDAVEPSEQKVGKEQEKEENLSKAEGPTNKITQLVQVGEKDEKGKAFNEEEEWEGIERTDIEKQFAVAAAYANSACGIDTLSKLSNEVQLQLYGLHKVATEGPCYESHPLALRASTRAKWHAWQKLGSMNPEAAMEHYMNLLSKSVPDWSEQPIVDIEHKESDQLTTKSGSCIEGAVAFGSASPEKGTETDASIQ